MTCPYPMRDINATTTPHAALDVSVERPSHGIFRHAPRGAGEADRFSSSLTCLNYRA